MMQSSKKSILQKYFRFNISPVVKKCLTSAKTDVNADGLRMLLILSISSLKIQLINFLRTLELPRLKILMKLHLHLLCFLFMHYNTKNYVCKHAKQLNVSH